MTPLNVAKTILVIDGARRVISADHTTTMWYLKNKPTALLGAAWKDKAFTSKLVEPATGLAEIVIAPKVLGKAVAFANRGSPLVSRLANAKIVKV